MTREGCAARLAVIAALCVLLVVPSSASAGADRCAEADHPGGEWPTYGGDLSNSRHQPKAAEVALGEAGDIAAAFIYETPGLINSTPIVDGGCIFLSSQGQSTSIARIAALDADDGAELWAQTFSIGQAGFGGPAVGSPALWGDLVITPVNKQGAPFLVANDRETGAERWRTTIDTQPITGVNASAVVHDGLVFMGFFGSYDAGSKERGGFVLVDAATGDLVERTYVIDDDAFDEDYAGAGIWATPAIDTETDFAYVGTSNPHSAQREHPRSDSILKIDLDRSSTDFGEVVASYKGLSDTGVEGASDQPVCKAKPDVYYAYSFSATCLAIDLDFGASPNLYTDGDGRKLVGELQKAGIYHIVDTEGMAGVARTPVGAPCFACNAASSAFADGRAFVAAGPPGEMVAVDGTLGTPAWAAPIGGGFTYNPVSVGGGVVWSVDSAGFLNGYDQDTGAQLVKRSLRDDTGASMFEATTSSGVAIAHNTLYTAATTFVIAYRPTS